MTTADATPTGPELPKDDLSDLDFAAGDEKQIQLLPTLRDVAIVSLIAVPIQMLATDLSVIDIVIGLAVLYVMCIGGLLLTKYVPLRLPSVAWISLVAILFTLPMLPWSGTILPLVSGIDFLALAVPPLAYAGFAISRMELDVMRRSGWKILIIALLVFTGTYVGSALIAEITLRVTS
ncbi:hypothetical protein M3F59_00720 [Brachybacterium muris]|uniref:Uncharacterized protein n=1 Tax=Brachybacterium muris UCD-AY4 TaxID=1249481 RepID=A0A022KVZ5_9MICO|nr:hypothetical protein [Brachybacterium muris]EYT48932.1 hypothetical protein D641_0109825 [Brachybacterium muris UCD-AY4]MCT1653274.1 hypothetical protein [Brachybacterium muris]MCT2260164.1 hypothetical protein [Brachybacterium muris]